MGSQNRIENSIQVGIRQKSLVLRRAHESVLIIWEEGWFRLRRIISQHSDLILDGSQLVVEFDGDSPILLPPRLSGRDRQGPVRLAQLGLLLRTWYKLFSYSNLEYIASFPMF